MRLIASLPCEKIITDAKGTPSLITILTEVEVGPIPAEGLPANAVAPTPWWVYTLWEGDESDKGIENVQNIVIYWPDGKEFAKNAAAFKIWTPEKPTLKHSISAQFIGFPLGQQGDVKIQIWIERNEALVGEVHEYTFTVKHAPVVATGS